MGLAAKATVGVAVKTMGLKVGFESELTVGVVVELVAKVAVMVGDAVGTELRLEEVGLTVAVAFDLSVVRFSVEPDEGDRVVGIPVEELVGLELVGSSVHKASYLQGTIICQEHDSKIGSLYGKHGWRTLFVLPIVSSVITTSMTASQGSSGDSW